jgi:TPR repeat protein
MSTSSSSSNNSSQHISTQSVKKPEPRKVVLPLPSKQAEIEYEEGKTHFENKQWELAVKRFEMAANTYCHPESMKYLAKLYEPSRLANASKVIEWTRRREQTLLSPQGKYMQAMHLARTTGKGGALDGEPIVMIRNAADLGYAPAMHVFGLYLRSKGKGAEAMAWFHKASASGCEDAEEPLAEGYENGIGVPVDVVAGAAWRARVVARQKQADEAREKQRQKDLEIAAKVKAEARSRAEEQRKKELDVSRRQAESAARRALDPALNSAIRSLEWGFYTSGIEQLSKLSMSGSVDAREFLDPDKSPISERLSSAMFYLGQYQASHADPAAAVKWYRKSAEGGFHEAMVTYAAYLIVGKGMERADPGQAMAWLMKAWTAGRNKEAALALGEAYTKGIGVQPDPTKAVTWYVRAWETGHYPEAAFAVGLAYATGFTPGAVDPSAWSQAQQGYGNSFVNEVLQKKSTEDDQEMQQQVGGSGKKLGSGASTPKNGGGLSRQGSTSSMNSINSISNGGVPNNMGSGAGVPLSKASSSSSSLAGSPATSQPSSPRHSPAPKKLLKNMTAVRQDVEKAAVWYRRAAELGHARACNNLGELHMTGRGVYRDDVLGFSLFKKAAQ